MLCYVYGATFDNSNLLIRHLKLAHGLCSDRNLCLRCGQSDCILEFGPFSGYRIHLNRVHSEIPNNVQTVVCAVSSPQYSDDDQPTDLATCPSTSSCDLPITNQSALDLCGSAVAQLQTAVSKRDLYFRKKWSIVDPVDKVLGTRFENRKNRSTGTYDQVVVTDTFSYVPILEILRSIFCNPHVFSLLKLGHVSKDGVYSDLDDGLYIKNHPLFSTDKHALQIQLFYDDFETANPLGSKKGIYKLGAIYFTLRNFPPKLNYSLTSIHLCALFHSQDIKI
ncbi:hypothetical protein N1851_008186 [Merluccius polli]|uniref:C2H2-type domain-containing protein n=1 Tax=Merluccius polli TaxID=89951 RepID=A0AA47N311_MERPO|nr:hypothetical protein N1851_008186 [Merluccius polli]